MAEEKLSIWAFFPTSFAWQPEYGRYIIIDKQCDMLVLSYLKKTSKVPVRPLSLDFVNNFISNNTCTIRLNQCSCALRLSADLIYIYIFEELIFIIGTASSYFIIFVDSMNPRIRKMFPTWTAMIAITSQLDGTFDSLNGKHLNAIWVSFFYICV